MKKKKAAIEKRSFFEKCDAFFEKYDRTWFWILFGLMLIVSIRLYDPRVSAGGDDSAYIVSACELLDEGKFPGFQGPLYPMVLALIYAVFGMSVTAFKIFSMLSMQACLFFTFRAFRRRIPATLLFISMVFIAFNSHVLYFASQTWNEAFYMFMQSLFLFVFFRFFIDRDMPARIPEIIRNHCWLAVALLGVITTRSVGYSLVLAVIGYFMFYRRWKNIGWLLACFVLCFGLYQLLKYLVWGDVSLQASGQGDALLNKDFYKPEYGREDFGGFLTRFWENSKQYFSHVFIMSGIYHKFDADGMFVSAGPLYTVLVYLFGLTGVWFAYKRNKYLFFAGILTGVFLAVSFLVLQVTWNQYRLIVPVYPFMALLLFSAVYYLLSLPKLRPFQLLLAAPVVICLAAIASDTSEAVRQADKLENEYSGLTPDWLHYAQASAWAAKHLPEDARVACRKPSISAMYGKNTEKFYGLYRVESGRFDAFYERWKADSLAFVIVPAEKLTDRMYQYLAGYCEARILLDESYFLVTGDTLRIKWLQERVKGFTAISSPEMLAPLVKQAEHRTAVYYADSLLLSLKQRKVTHILTASLRQNPNIKNGNIINTVERVTAFIQEKYPAFIQPLQTFGAEDDEPAVLYRINWEAIEGR
jgi:hypothetical protein